VRLNFNWFIDDAEFEYLLEALTMVARDGWRLMGDYRLDPTRGIWRHRDAIDVSERMVTLGAFMASNGMADSDASEPSTPRPAFSDVIARARKILDTAGRGQACAMTTALPERYTALQWFVTAPESEPAAVAG
jgi:hypothetical protein